MNFKKNGILMWLGMSIAPLILLSGCLHREDKAIKIGAPN